VAENDRGVTTVTASDPDAGTMLPYSIAGGAERGAVLDHRQHRRAELSARTELR
jgi:electron transfer flavoprotein alpha/beta subunit